jgi:hypothetical protein
MKGKRFCPGNDRSAAQAPTSQPASRPGAGRPSLLLPCSYYSGQLPAAQQRHARGGAPRRMERDQRQARQRRGAAARRARRHLLAVGRVAAAPSQHTVPAQGKERAGGVRMCVRCVVVVVVVGGGQRGRGEVRRAGSGRSARHCTACEAALPPSTGLPAAAPAALAALPILPHSPTPLQPFLGEVALYGPQTRRGLPTPLPCSSF